MPFERVSRSVVRAEIVLAIASISLVGVDSAVHAESVTFNQSQFPSISPPLEHGRIISNQFSFLGLTVSADNVGGGPDLAIIFDSTLTATQDPDLEGPPPNLWKNPVTGETGNVAANTVLGNLLIIAERGDTVPGDPTRVEFSDTDDEGSRPAGSIFFDYSVGLTEFGMTLVDVENDAELDGYFASFHSGATLIGAVPWRAFIQSGVTDPLTGTNLGSQFIDSTINFAGDNTANLIQPITIGDLNTVFGTSFATFDRVEIFFNGSGAIGEVNWEAVPEPSSWVLGILGAAGLGFVYRRQRRRRRSQN